MNTRTGLYPNLIAFNTIIRKEVSRFMRIWSQTILPPSITMSLYFIIFGKFIGSQINLIDGFSYIQYIVPGLIMMSIMTSSYANTASSFFLSKFNRSIEEMLVAPMPNYIILLGFTLGGALRGLMVGAIVTLVSFLFTHMPFQHPGIICIMALLSAMVLSLGGFINGIYAKRFDDISFIPTFVLTPLTYLGGVFYSIQQLPPTWRAISVFNPVFNMVDTFRYGFLGMSDMNIYFGLTLVIVLFFILFAWALLLLYRGVGIKV
ncbi:MAG: ABC transporter permease [Gammaproteobacteria bacterium RIFCSPHIGHO2_12_FULL_45_12]|nr:MAG: ABC transporter permease [Gammaproteobacteria bacterium RIFCSPHIGHO2_12_FULL_45_12]